MPPADRPDVFARATTRLVVLFTAIVILLVVASGVFFYLTVRTNITGVAQGSSGSGGETEVERVLATRSIDRVRWQLAALDGAIIVAVGALGSGMRAARCGPSASSTAPRSASWPTPRTSCARRLPS